MIYTKEITSSFKFSLQIEVYILHSAIFFLQNVQRNINFPPLHLTFMTLIVDNDLMPKT